MANRAFPRRTEFSARRMILAGGFAVAVTAAPFIAALSGTVAAPAFAACAGGESPDTFTGTCTPDLVPNSPFGSIPGNPDVPEIDNIPVTGGNSGQSIGLAEEQQSEGPAAIPHSSVSSSP